MDLVRNMVYLGITVAWIMIPIPNIIYEFLNNIKWRYPAHALLSHLSSLLFHVGGCIHVFRHTRLCAQAPNTPHTF